MVKTNILKYSELILVYEILQWLSEHTAVQNMCVIEIIPITDFKDFPFLLGERLTVLPM
jgi:hypothetical protein